MDTGACLNCDVHAMLECSVTRDVPVAWIDTLY